VIFLSDYDMLLTERLVQGWMFGSTRRVDLGKLAEQRHEVLVNGESTFRNWTAGGRRPTRPSRVGAGDGRNMAMIRPGCGRSRALYELLEHEVISEFYSRDERVFLRWVRGCGKAWRS